MIVSRMQYNKAMTNGRDIGEDTYLYYGCVYTENEQGFPTCRKINEEQQKQFEVPEGFYAR